MPRQLAEGIEPWGRQPKEPDRAWRVFCAFRDSEDRVKTRVGEANGADARTVSVWSREWVWDERVLAYDRHVDQQRVKAALDRSVEVSRRVDQIAENGIILVGAALQTIAQKAKAGTMGPSETDALNKLSSALAKFDAVGRGARGQAPSAIAIMTGDTAMRKLVEGSSTSGPAHAALSYLEAVQAARHKLEAKAESGEVQDAEIIEPKK